MYKETLLEMLKEGFSENKLIDGIQNKIFDASGKHFGDDVAVIMSIAKNNESIRPKAFSAIKDILYEATADLNKGDANVTRREIDNMQEMLYDLAEIRQHNPKLFKETRDVYKAFKNVMQEYAKSPIFEPSKHSPATEDYYYGDDIYKFTESVAREWDAVERSEEARKRIESKLLKQEIGDYAKTHAKAREKEERADRMARDKVLAEYRVAEPKNTGRQVGGKALYGTANNLHAGNKLGGPEADTASHEEPQTEGRKKHIRPKATLISRALGNDYRNYK